MGCCQAKNTPRNSLDYHDKRYSIQQSPTDQADILSIDRKLLTQKKLKIDPRNFSSQQTEDFSPFRPIERNLSLEEESMISKVFNAYFTFDYIPESSLKKLLKRFKVYLYESQQVVFSEGQLAFFFYIVSSGSVEVLIKNSQKGVIKKGGFFGELALFHDSKRSCSVKTMEKTVCLVLDRESFKNVIKSVSEQRASKNKIFIENLALFKRLTPDQKETILKLLVVHKYYPGQKIIREKEFGDLLFIIKKGTVLVSVGGVKKRHLSKGDFFGEQALLYNFQRTASIEAVSKVSLLSLKSDDLFRVFGSRLDSLIFENSIRISIEKSEILNKLNKDQVEKIIENVTVFRVESGQNLINKGENKGQKIFIVLRGEIKGDRTFANYEIIGDKDLYENKNEEFLTDWTATKKTDVGVIQKTDLESFVSENLKKTIEKNQVLNIMKKVQILRNLPTSTLDLLHSHMKVNHYPLGAIIFKQGSQADSFFIIEEGNVEVQINGEAVRSISKCEFFGERGIIFNERRTATVVSQDSTCWVLTKEDFLTHIAESQQKTIAKRLRLQDDKVELSDLSIKKFLGKGMFGAVFLAVHKTSKIKYALKTVPNEGLDLKDNLIIERDIMLQIDHPFIVKLVKSFKDLKFTYFLMELIRGKDLFDVMKDARFSDYDSARFYSAGILLILEHLHERKIIYRDLKPENIMVDKTGYLKLIDFGTAKVVKNRTYTVVGTIHYMAPEVIQGVGYGAEVDYWSLGVILYELCFGTVPFGEGEFDPFKVYNLVLKGEITYPILKMEGKGIIDKLLNKNPVFRGTPELLKKHSWFEGVDWELLISKEVEAPYLPVLESLSLDEEIEDIDFYIS